MCSAHFATQQWFSFQGLHLFRGLKEFPVAIQEVVRAVGFCPSCLWRHDRVETSSCFFSFCGSQCFTRSLGLDSYSPKPLYWAGSKCSGKHWNKCPWFSFFALLPPFFFCFSANEKIEDINGCPKNRSQMVSSKVVCCLCVYGWVIVWDCNVWDF